MAGGSSSGRSRQIIDRTLEDLTKLSNALEPRQQSSASPRSLTVEDEMHELFHRRGSGRSSSTSSASVTPSTSTWPSLVGQLRAQHLSHRHTHIHLGNFCKSLRFYLHVLCHILVVVIFPSYKSIFVLLQNSYIRLPQRAALGFKFTIRLDSKPFLKVFKTTSIYYFEIVFKFQTSTF